MDPTEALQHIRTLIHVAAKTDDPKLLHQLLEQMKTIVKKAALPPIKLKRPTAKNHSGKVVQLKKRS